MRQSSGRNPVHQGRMNKKPEIQILPTRILEEGWWLARFRKQITPPPLDGEKDSLGLPAPVEVEQ